MKRPRWTRKDPGYEREQARYEFPVPSRRYLQQVLADEAGPLTANELRKSQGFGREVDKEALERRLDAMVRDGTLVRNRRGAFGPAARMQAVAGVVVGHRDGYGFLVRDDDGPDVFLNPRQMREVLSGDRALVRIRRGADDARPEGVIVDVLERGTREIVGRFHRERGMAYVVPDQPRITHDVLIPPGEEQDAQAGQMVVAEIVRPPDRRSLPVGRVREVLGEHLAPGMEIEAALRAYGIPHAWPDDVVHEAEALPGEVRPSDLRDRRDLRDLPLVTIDGEDARDFDDAVHAAPHPRGGWSLWVAIADVSAYVRPGSALDREAARRGNSVYFPERVVPMLPEALSNGLCSLNPHVDRLCMACEMRVTPDGQVTSSRFHEAVMHSAARLTYTRVFELLEHPDRAKRTHVELLPHLQALDAVFEALHGARELRGALDFDGTETRIEFDEGRKVRRIVPVTRNRAHRLIEECMVAANVEAARFVLKHRRAAPHRVHGDPDPEKVRALRAMLQARGLSLGGGDRPATADFAGVLATARQRPDGRVVQSLVLRTLMQAQYHAEPGGHFGLGLEHYAHFTSPIRRYPDLLLHRALRDQSRRRDGDDASATVRIERHAAHCTTTERRADEAVRDVVAWLKCEYMRHHVGESFGGVITAVTNFGVFVELDGLYIDGLVHISTLPNDYYVYDAGHHRLHGERSGRRYEMGDPLEVKVVRVDLDERKIDLEPREAAASTGRRPRRRRSGR